jgi:Protein of unknown function (DUF1302)
MDGRRTSRSVWACVLAVAACVVWVGRANATFRYGDIQISGNIQTQNLFRIQDGTNTFNSFNDVQQRNTFRLQYEHALVKQGSLLSGLLNVKPLFKSAAFFAYYRFVYDSIYDIAPGPFVRSQDGSRSGKISDFKDNERRNMALEDVLREVFVDLDLSALPLSFRIGRQQIVWGEAISFRALDSVNALDLTWHAQQEAGLFGKVGFDELRIPAWTVKAIYNVGEVIPFLSNTFVEAYDIPFEFTPAKVRFDPAPWSVPARPPFRAGLTVPVAAGVNVQACFDDTGSTAPSGLTPGMSNVDFSHAAKDGLCPMRGLQRSRLRQGIYDGHDPSDVNQFGVRLGAVAPFGINFTLNYLHRRNLGADIPGAAIAKAQVGAVNGNIQNYITVAPHDTFDPITRKTTSTVGYARVPLEFYYPYVEVFGFSANYAEEYTGSIINAESAWQHGLPISTLNPFGNGIRKSDTVLSAVGFDRPTWIRWLNPRSTWTIITQADINWITDHHSIKTGRSPFVQDNGKTIFLDGDTQLPNSTLLSGAFGDRDLNTHVDRLKSVECVLITAMTTFYRGGTFVPTLAIITDLVNFPSNEFNVSFDFLPTNNIILTPALRIFTNYGRNVDEPWGVGRFSQNDEVQFKATYQF